MTVKVYHCGVIGDEYPVLVAEVRTNDLEEAWRLTQNFMGSWSKGKFLLDGDVVKVNPDYSELMTVLAKLPVHKGVTYGLRSTMVGDIMELDGVRHEVMPFGFREVAVSA